MKPLSPLSNRKEGLFIPLHKKRRSLATSSNGIRQRPILPGRVQPSTFGTGELNYCVRYGNRWDLSVITTGRVFEGLRPLSFHLSATRL